jgi:ribosomal protein S18 acetylase RimI-like enzyme
VATLTLRPATVDDVAAISAVTDAQDTAWWGSPDGDIDDTRHELDQVVSVVGSLETTSRVAIVDGAVVGFALLSGHGHTSTAVDPSAPLAHEARAALFHWLVGAGAGEIESPAQDLGRLAAIAAVGLVPRRSSFELERPGDVADLEPAVWPGGIAPVPFRNGVDDEEVHEMIYSVWLDVEGHTLRSLAEWRERLLGGTWFEQDLVVLARRDAGAGPVAGVSLGRRFGAEVGWVSQLAVGHPDRGLGLGRAILVEACHRLGQTGVGVIGLGVEADNERALGLYRSVGFEVAREWVHCEPGRPVSWSGSIRGTPIQGT